MIPTREFVDEKNRRHRLDGPAYSSQSGSLRQWIYHGEDIIELLDANTSLIVTHYYDNDREESLFCSMEEGMEYCQDIFNQVIKLKAFL